MALEASESAEAVDSGRERWPDEVRVAMELTELASPAVLALSWWSTTGPYGELPAMMSAYVCVCVCVRVCGRVRLDCCLGVNGLVDTARFALVTV